MVRDFIDADGERWTVVPTADPRACYIVSARGEQLPIDGTRRIDQLTVETFYDLVRIYRKREARRLEDEAADRARWAEICREDRADPAPAEHTLQRDRRGRIADESAPKWRRPKE